MRLLIVDPNGAALDIACRAKACGHQVKMQIRDTPKTSHIGKGLVDVIRDITPWVNWSDLIFVADNVKYLDQLDAIRKTGKPIFGPTKETTAWELDRQCGMSVMKKHGVSTPPCFEFTDYDKAIAHVKKRGGRWVSKPSGDADKALSYCSKSEQDMIYMLERWKKNPKMKREFILQEFIPGIEMAVGAWCGPRGFGSAWCENFEFKKLMDGDMGVATGEQGTVLRYVTRSKLARKVLAPFEEALVKQGYTGYIDINCIIDERGDPWPLEFTMRPGWPTFNIQQELHGEDPVEFMDQILSGESPPISDKIAMGVVLSIPDYPYSHLTRKEVIGIPVYGTDTRLLRHIHWCEMMQGVAPGEDLKPKTMPVTAGDYVLVMTATGSTVWDTKQTVYRRLKRLTIPNSPMYRTDIGDRLSKQLPQLQAHGYAMGMEFSSPQTP